MLANVRSALDVWPEQPREANSESLEIPVIGTKFVWDGDQVAEEVPLRVDGSLCPENATFWLFEPGTHRLLAKQHSRDLLYHAVVDHLGTPREFVSEKGQLMWSGEQHLWGGLRRTWVPANDSNRSSEQYPIRFQGQREDTETGLFYNGLRYYDPVAAQYLSSDPIGLTGGYRPFGYVTCPTIWIDPIGLAGGGPLGPTPTGKGAVGTITGPNIPGGSQTGYSTGAGGPAITNPAVQQAYDQVPPEKRSFYHGKCCEGDNLSKAANDAGAKTQDELRQMTEGAHSNAYNSSGTYLPPCSSCGWVQRNLGITSGK